MMKVAEVATRLNCSISTIYSLIEFGRLAHHRCPGIRVSEEQLLAFLDSTKQGCEPEPVKVKTPHPRLRHISLK